MGSAHQPVLEPLTILFACDPRHGEIVVAVNALARQAGIRLGMPLAEASALAEYQTHQPAGPARRTSQLAASARDSAHPPSFLIQSHDPVADQAALARLAERCELFSPFVGWETVSSLADSAAKSLRQTTWNLEPGTWNFLGPDFLLLDITGIGSLFGGEENLVRAVTTDLARAGYEARAAIADTVAAVWGAARQSSFKFQVSSSKLLNAPNLEPETCNLQPDLWSLDALRLPRETIDLLAQLGVTQIGQVLALPRESLRARFGELIVLRIHQWLGTAQETIVPHRPPPAFIAQQVLDYPEERPTVVADLVRDLVRRIAHELAARREGVLRLGARLDCIPGRPLTFEVGLFRPSADEVHLWDLVRMQLEQHPLPGAVGRLQLAALLTARLENRQALLFAADEHEADRQFALFIDRCASRLGPRAVLQPETTADPLPEKAVRYRPGGKRPKSTTSGARQRETGNKKQVPSSKFQGKTKHSQTWNLEPGIGNSSPLYRPLAVFSPPIVLSAISIAPDGPPLWFQWNGCKHEAVYHWGPERIEVGWWRGATVRRDYWRIETTTGERYWLFRNLSTSQWYLQGQYS